MDHSPLRVLLVEGDSDEASRISSDLAESDTIFSVTSVDSLSDAVGYLVSGSALDAVLLSMSLPDSNGRHSFDAVSAVAEASIPVILVAAPHEMDLAMSCIKDGAQDVIIKGDDHLTHSISFIIRQSVARHQAQIDRIRQSVVTGTCRLTNTSKLLESTERYVDVAKSSGATLHRASALLREHLIR